MDLANWIMFIIQTVVAAITGGVGWLFKKSMSRLERVEEKQRKLELSLTKDYIRKDDYNIAMGNVMKKLDRIYEILIDRK